MPRYKPKSPRPPKKLHRAPSTQTHAYIAGGGRKAPMWCQAAKKTKAIRRKVVSTGNNPWLKKK